MKESTEVTAVSPAKSHKGLIISLVVLLVLALGGAGTSGYFFVQETKDHDSTIKQLDSQTKIVNDNAQLIRDSKLEPAFRSVMQTSANRNCSSGSAIVFNTTTSLEKNSDGSTKKYIAVGQAVCNEGDSVQSGKVLFVAVQSYDSITWEGSYVAPSKLPKYIFNTDPALYNRKFNNPATF